jgi:anthranilate synthase component 1
MMLNRFPDKERFLQLAGNANVIPVCAEILADTDTPVSLLKKFRTPFSPVFLLESVEGGERWGRYSFLGVSARSRVMVFSDRVEVRSNGSATSVSFSGSPLPVLRALMARYRPAQLEELPRFWGGLVGYFTYETVSFFEKIPNRLPGDRPLAAFVIPDTVLIFDNVRHTLRVLSIAFIEEGADAAETAAAYEEARSRIATVLQQMESPVSTGTDVGADDDLSPKTRLAPEAFHGRVKKIKEYIRAGDVIQTVISQPFSCPAPKDLWSLYRAQRYVNPSPYLFFLQIDDTTLIGSSPETMVRLENGVATVRPIAGTRHRGVTEQEDRALADVLLSDEKERAEHLMLVDLGRNDLGRVAETGTVQVTDLMVIERYSHVMHLVSNVNCHLAENMDAWDLLAATFPAGTLTGAPKVRAMEIIAELEQYPRGPYGGAVGYISFSGNMDLAITIRTACIECDRLTVRAGAGIVADSDPEKERIETINKAMAIDRALNLLKGSGNAGHDR